MEKYTKIEVGPFNMFYGYRIFTCEGKKMFDMTCKIYSDNNEWKENALTDVVINRCNLSDIVEALNMDEDGLNKSLFESLSKGTFNEQVIDAMEGIQDKLVITVGYPINEDGDKTKSSLYACVNEEDLSELFSGFDVHDKKAVKNAFIILSENNYPLNLTDLDGFKRVLAQKISMGL